MCSVYKSAFLTELRVLYIFICFYTNTKLFRMHSSILRTQEVRSELTLSLSNQYDTPEVFYGDSKEIVQILDMTFSK